LEAAEVKFDTALIVFDIVVEVVESLLLLELNIFDAVLVKTSLKLAESLAKRPQR